MADFLRAELFGIPHFFHLLDGISLRILGDVDVGLHGFVVTVADDVVEESEEDALALLAAENFLEHEVHSPGQNNPAGGMTPQMKAELAEKFFQKQ